jgi:lon-related putative ATP-dependent protease
MIDKWKLPVSALTPAVHADQLGFSDTSQLEPIEEPIGQQRAIEALRFGLSMPSHGFNIYAAGPIGTGKWGVIKQMIDRVAKGAPTPPDWCYVNNFQDPSRPAHLSFPAGQGRGFKMAMAALIQSLRREIPLAFESSKYLEARAKVMEETESKKKALFKDVHEEARARDFGFQDEPTGFSLVPTREGRPMTDEEMERLSKRDRERVTDARKELETKIREFQSHIHALDHEVEHRLREMDRHMVRHVLQSRFELLRKTFHELPLVLEYLERVHDDIVSNYKDFLHREGPTLPILGIEVGGRHADLTRYQVNLVVEHQAGSGAPIIDESHPTYANLIGKIERKSHFGVIFTDFTEIRSGAFHHANGGYLILNATDVLRQPFAWDALKRVIKTRAVKIEDPGEFYGFSTSSLKPEPIPVDTKIVLIGPPYLYHLLQTYEEDFPKIFKVKADFDVDVPRDDSQDLLYARFLARLCRDEHLPPFRADAVAEFIRQGMRLADRHDRLSLRMSLLSDLAREAGFWARKQDRFFVSREDLEEAVSKRRSRVNLPEEWIQDDIKEGSLIVDLEHEVVGQVNGLSVHLLGDYSFGRPCRITARTFVGTKGVIDIQREAKMAGSIHSKGVMTLSGFLAGKFAGAHPFALSATLTFEQTYSEIEGDSAAVAELAAILSSLADAPVRQWLAVTGSVNQLGEVQPIGGVNEKIEGFFASCRARGLTGRQGVIVPLRNTRHLALNHEVVEAVERGEFAVYAVSDVEEALELLTGLPAGERQADGTYPDKTLYGRAARRIAEMAQIVAGWGEHLKEGQGRGSG